MAGFLGIAISLHSSSILPRDSRVISARIPKDLRISPGPPAATAASGSDGRANRRAGGLCRGRKHLGRSDRALEYGAHDASRRNDAGGHLVGILSRASPGGGRMGGRTRLPDLPDLDRKELGLWRSLRSGRRMPPSRSVANESYFGGR